MGSGMLRAEVDGVMADLAVFDANLPRNIEGIAEVGFGVDGFEGLQRGSLMQLAVGSPSSAGKGAYTGRGSYRGSYKLQAPGAAACDAVERRHLRCVQVNWATRLISSSSSVATTELPRGLS